jgi:hypothetical protein
MHEKQNARMGKLTAHWIKGAHKYNSSECKYGYVHAVAKIIF